MANDHHHAPTRDGHRDASEVEPYYRHGLHRMVGRGRDGDRAASPLELLYDLTFVAAFGVAGNELAHLLAEGHLLAATGAYVFAMLAIVRAWTNFSWFASAFDTDDWLFRLLTMVQMAGVVVLAIGLPALFDSIDRGDTVIDNTILVMGYVVMRVALVFQWLRAASTDPRYRAAALVNATFIGISQVGFVTLAILHLDSTQFLIAGGLLWALEVLGPLLSERTGKHDGWTIPWHAHHIAERFALLAIIALGETVFGTLAAAQAITTAEGWTLASVITIGIGIALGFALWWVYFLVPSAPILARGRAKAALWSAGHIAVYVAIAAVGAGLHVIGYQYEEGYHVTSILAVASIAVPVSIFTLSLLLIHGWLVSAPPKNLIIQLVAVLLPLLAVGLSALGTDQWVCLLVVLASPAAVIISYEAGGWRALEQQLRNTLTTGSHASPTRPSRAETS